MMKDLIKKIRSEEGDSNVIEAVIVYPLVMLVVIFLVLLGYIYGQEGYLNYVSQKMATYLSKAVVLPGYQYLEKPIYFNSTSQASIGDINKAMESNAPYRYLLGIFSDPTIEDSNGNDVSQKTANELADNYLKSHGLLKAAPGEIHRTSKLAKGTKERTNADGYYCSIKVDTSAVTVTLAQNFIFSKMFSMIGIGGKDMIISATSYAAVSDPLEVVKVSDMTVDLLTFLAKKLGIDTSKIKTLKSIIEQS